MVHVVAHASCYLLTIGNKNCRMTLKFHEASGYNVLPKLIYSGDLE